MNFLGNIEKYFDEIYAYLLDGKSIVNREKTYVDEIADTLFMYFDRKRFLMLFFGMGSIYK
ncbi:hypothetical protein CG479_004350 [Bacillus cytotoxicus]|nr:hypothetical protein CG479_004350 [Bacillus cytotoxicus]